MGDVQVELDMCCMTCTMGVGSCFVVRVWFHGRPLFVWEFIHDIGGQGGAGGFLMPGARGNLNRFLAIVGVVSMVAG